MLADKEAAEKHNKAGNAACKSGDYLKAIECYTHAACASPQAKYYTNRANAHLRLQDAQSALSDADEAIKLDNRWMKGHYYKGVSLMQLSRFVEARKALQAGMKIEPGHVDIKAALWKCNTSITRSARNNPSLEPLPEAVADHDTETAELRYQNTMKQVMALVKQQSYSAAANFKMREFKLPDLMPYIDVPGAEAYLRARLLRDDGYKALQTSNIDAGIPKLAAGYCLEPRAMGYPSGVELQSNLLPLLHTYMQKHPNNPAGPLLLAFWSAPSQSGRWLEQRLRELEPKAPENWRPGVLREVASICIRDDVADYEGAYKAAIEGLHLKAKDPDLLFYKAWAYKLLSFKRLGQDPCPGFGTAGFDRWFQKRVDDTTAVNRLFQDFIDAAPMRHSKVPNAYYYMAERVLCNRIVSRIPMSRHNPSDVAVAEETAVLFDKGRAAELSLPPFFLPIVCASRESVPMLLEHHMPGFLAARDGSKNYSSSGSEYSSRRNAVMAGGDGDSSTPLCSKGRISNPTRAHGTMYSNASASAGQLPSSSSSRFVYGSEGKSSLYSSSQQWEKQTHSPATRNAQLIRSNNSAIAAVPVVAAGQLVGSSSSRSSCMMNSAGKLGANYITGSSGYVSTQENVKSSGAADWSCKANSASSSGLIGVENDSGGCMAPVVEHTCIWCGTKEPKMKKCGGCGARYCSKYCQTDHWNAGHKHLCGRV